MLYSISADLVKTSADILWWAIIGTTSQYLDNLIDEDHYLNNVQLFQSELSRIEFTFEKDEVNNLENLDHLENEAIFATEKAEKFHEGRICKEKECKLMLLRHWSLFDSLNYSTFIATKLRVWSERGRNRLSMLLSKMG
jgi:cell division control protein 45